MVGKIHAKRIFIISVMLLTLGMTGCASVIDETAFEENKKGGDLVLRDSLIFKPRRPSDEILTNKGLEDVLRRLDLEKVQGVWETGGEATYSGGNIDLTLNPNTYAGSGLYSISAEQKAKFVVNDPALAKRIAESGMSLSSAMLKYPEFRRAAEDNLANSFDLRSPGHFLTAEQWITHINKMKGGSKGVVLDYHLNGVKITMHQSEMLALVVKSIYKASQDMAAKGMPVNPDFLVAMSINETAWGTNRHSRRVNSWFSYGAINESPDSAHAYPTPYEAAVKIIERLSVQYLNPPKGGNTGAYYTPEKGPTIFGANQRYAKVDTMNFPNYLWTQTAVKVMRSAFSTHNYNPPIF